MQTPCRIVRSVEFKENRQFRRLKTSIPCVVAWGRESVSGQITNLSHGGAFVAHTSLLPSEGTRVVVTFQVGGEEIPFAGRVREITETDQVTSSFGVAFLDPQQDIELKMVQLLDALLADVVGEDPSDT